MYICSSKWLASEFELNNNVIMLSPTEQSLQSLKSLFPFVPKLHPLNGSCGQLISRFRAPNFRADSWPELRQNCLWQKPVTAMGKDLSKQKQWEGQKLQNPATLMQNSCDLFGTLCSATAIAMLCKSAARWGHFVMKSNSTCSVASHGQVFSFLWSNWFMA